MSLHYQSAFAIGEDIRAGRISATEVLEYFLARVETYNPSLNAVVALDREGARRRAEQADVEIARGDSRGPLHGVPMTIKDAFCTAGLVTVGGIPDCQDFMPSRNAIAVQRLIDAGVNVFGKTNVPFMSADLQSYNEVYGVTNNPWHRGRTSGGSSGGAAAALAAGLTPLELGSDIGGSIRTPAHFNGVFGHKSSFGIVSGRGHLPPGEGTLSESDLSVVGPLATCPDDLEAALDLLLGPAPEEARGWRLDLPGPRTEDVNQLRVAVWLDDPTCPVDDEVQSAIRAAAQSLQDAGAQVDFQGRPKVDFAANVENYGLLLSAAIGAGMPEAVFEASQVAVAAADASDMDQRMLQMRGIALSHRDWLRQNERRLRTRASWDEFFQDYDVLLCPATHVAAFPHDHTPDMHARTLSVNGESRPYMDLLAWAGLTLNSYLPASVAPAGLTLDGLPVGVQIVGAYLDDRTTLAVARMLQEHHRAFIPPPGFGEL